MGKFTRFLTRSLVDRLFHVYYSNKYKNYFIFILKLGVSISCHSFDSLNEAIWFRNQLYKLLNIKDTKPEISRELISQLTEIQIQVLTNRFNKRKSFYMPKIKQILKLEMSRRKKRESLKAKQLGQEQTSDKKEKEEKESTE